MVEISSVINKEKLNIKKICDIKPQAFFPKPKIDSSLLFFSPKENYFIDHQNKIAVCGDWLINSRVEGAYISANELSKEFI